MDDLYELLRALAVEIPTSAEARAEGAPLVSAETESRQYGITGLRRNQYGDVVLRLEFKD